MERTLVRPSPPARSATPASGPRTLRELIQSPELTFLMEAHNGLSAKIAEEAGFEALWASGLAISASLGVRDSNEASWTQVLDVLEFMSDATPLPILVDGDTGYGNFNNMRRLVGKLEQRGLAGVCIEDKLFPKTNSFLHGTKQELADVDEFCGRIQAGHDARGSDEFVIVARTEAFIAGLGIGEALKRAHAYQEAGADAILVHSARPTCSEVLAFKEEWGDRLPVVIVPTKYYTTPTETFREHGFSAVIWANHLMRSCIPAMQRTAREIFEKESIVDVEDRVAPLVEVFRLQNAPELEQAEERYLPRNVRQTRVVILGAGKGVEMGELTADRPKCMVEVGGRPMLESIVETYRSVGVKDIAIVRGYCKDEITVQGATFYDNDESQETHEAYSLHCALPALEGDLVVCYGDVLMKKFIPEELIELEDDFAVFVDTNWQESRNADRYADYVQCSEPSSHKSAFREVTLKTVSDTLDPEVTDGEWMGLLRTSPRGTEVLRSVVEELVSTEEGKRSADMAAVLRAILDRGHDIRVIYTTGNWLDVDSVDEVLLGSTFGR